MNHWIEQTRRNFARDYTTTALKTMIVVWALLVIFATIFVVDNKWILAGILAYEVLP